MSENRFAMNKIQFNGSHLKHLARIPSMPKLSDEFSMASFTSDVENIFNEIGINSIEKLFEIFSASGVLRLLLKKSNISSSEGVG